MTNVKQKPKLLILGGGYVTITATRKLHKAIQNDEIDVTVVSRENFHCFHGSVGEMLTGLISVSNIASPVRRIFTPARIIIGNVEEILLQKQQVGVRNFSSDEIEYVTYDHLLIALGTTENYELYPGLKEHGFCLKTYEDCFKLKNHIIQQLELAGACDDEEQRKAHLTFIVAGGGYSGTEVTGQLTDMINSLCKNEYKHIDRKECTIKLVTKSHTILPELFFGKKASGYGVGHPELVQYASDHLKQMGAGISLNTRVIAATPHAVHLSDGSIIETKTIINAVGTKAIPVIEALDVEKDEQGRIITESDMRVKGYDNVWAGGDCAALPHTLGNYCPPVGTFAIEIGKFFGRNFKRVLENKPTRPFTYVGIGQGVSIGHRNAILEFKGIRIKGFIGWFIWRLFILYFLPTWDRRLRIIYDWFVSMVVGRDIVDMAIHSDKKSGIQHHRFQDGEKIITLNSNHTHEHIITRGKVILYSNQQFIKDLEKGESISLSSYKNEDRIVAYAVNEVSTIYVEKKSMQLIHELHHASGQRLRVLKGNMPYKADFHPERNMNTAFAG